MRDVQQAVVGAADRQDPVLVTGEVGAGKEVVARTIHFLSPRWAQPVVKLNVTSLPPDLLKAELVGQDTRSRSLGRATGGSLILCEVCDIPLTIQAEFLSLLDDPEHAGVRILATSSRDLSAMAAASAFRPELLRRLDTVRIVVPPLRQRREEIPHLVDHFGRLFARDFSRPVPMVSPQLIDLMMRYDWPGNVHELEHLVKRWVVLGDEGHVLGELEQRIEWLQTAAVAPGAAGGTGESLRDIGRRAARQAERAAVQAALERARGNRAAAARALKTSYKTLLQKMAEAGLANRQHDKRER